jgi:hypothetical protein
VTTAARELDLLVARLASVRDDELASEPGSAAASALFDQIVSTAVEDEGRRSSGSRRRLAVALSLAAAVLLAVALPAVGVRSAVTSLFGWNEQDPPERTAPDFVIASGVAGIPWKIVATASDQGLCADFIARHPVEGWIGAPICGPTDLRGDPFARDALHWIEAFGTGWGIGGLDRTFAWGRLADDVESLELVLTDGSRVQATVVEGPAALDTSIDYYWAAWPCGSAGCLDDTGALVRMAIARDGSGRVLERRLPVWNGNPTGDPNGLPPPRD